MNRNDRSWNPWHGCRKCSETGNVFVKDGRTYYIKDAKTLIDGNDIYFVTYTSSRKVAHYCANSKACVYFYEKGQRFSGVEIKGNMVVLNDQPTKDRFWKPFFKRFYRKGVTDPDYCILKFTGFEAQWFTNQRTETVKL